MVKTLLRGVGLVVAAIAYFVAFEFILAANLPVPAIPEGLRRLVALFSYFGVGTVLWVGLGMAFYGASCLAWRGLKAWWTAARHP